MKFQLKGCDLAGQGRCKIVRDCQAIATQFLRFEGQHPRGWQLSVALAGILIVF